MKRNTKILLVSIALVVLLGAGAIGGFIWFVASNAEGWMQKGREREEAGRAAGTDLDSRGCVDRALAEYRKQPGQIPALSHRIWLKGCLATAEPDYGICPKIEPGAAFDQIREFIASREAFCESHGLGADQNCQQFAQAVEEFCFKDTAPAHDAPG